MLNACASKVQKKKITTVHALIISLAMHTYTVSKHKHTEYAE